MFKKHHVAESPTDALGACGYPQSFIDALAALDGAARKDSEPAALVIVSIDNLSMIMSGYSMAVAEAVMAELQAVIATHNPHGTTTRVQRDQFGVLMPHKSEHDAARWCNEIEEAIRSYSYESRYGDLHCITRTSLQMLPDRLSSADEILGRALVNLTDREEGEPVAGDISGAESREEMGMANFLGQAVQEGRIRLAYQPVIDSKTGEVAHYEGLLRLYSEDGKISSAGTLIPIAERMGFVPMIDKLVLGKILAELRADKDVVLALNVSNLTTQDHTYFAMLAEELEQTPEVANRLIIELTETAVHGDLRHLSRFCAEVQALGCQVALDDFGAGYTSFRQLKALSVDMVKIDGAFVRDLTDNADSRFFVKTLLDFTRGFGLKSVAEFVENGEIAKMLMELGVDMLQGYYFAKPLNHRPWLKDGDYS